MNIALLDKIKMRANQLDENAAASYREALRDAEEFWRLWHSLSDDLLQKKTLREEYLNIVKG